jgi:hypothetical protein
MHAEHGGTVPAEPKSASKWNVKRGLFRLWVLLTIGWVVVAGGLGVAIWSSTLAQIGHEVIGWVTPDSHSAAPRKPPRRKMSNSSRSRRLQRVTCRCLSPSLGLPVSYRGPSPARIATRICHSSFGPLKLPAEAAAFGAQPSAHGKSIGCCTLL